MSEIEDLIGIYGAIDRAVVDDPSLVEIVEPYLGAYSGGAAAGWFAEFQEWTQLVAPGADYPSLRDAFAHLGDPSTERTNRMAARQLLATAVAVRVFPELLHDATESELVAGSLAHPVIVGSADLDRARALLEVLASDRFEGLGQWAEMLDFAFGEALIVQSLAVQHTAPPCTSRVITVTVGDDPDPVTVIESSFCTSVLTFDQASRFLDPARWPDCHPLWCSMKHTGTSAAGNPIYEEVVSVDCAHKDSVWTASACLEFQRTNVGNGAIVTYDLCPGSPQPGDMVVVDSGSLTVLQQGPEVCVLTTKRVKFDHPFGGASLSMLTCAMGFGANLEDLVFNCAMHAEPGGGYGSLPPTKSVDTPANHRQGEGGMQQPRKPNRRRRRSSDPADDVSDVVSDIAEATKQCIEDCATAYKDLYDKAKGGEITADELVRSGAAMWSRLLRDGALAVDLGLKVAASVAAQARDDSEG